MDGASAWSSHSKMRGFPWLKRPSPGCKCIEDPPVCCASLQRDLSFKLKRCSPMVRRQATATVLSRRRRRTRHSAKHLAACFEFFLNGLELEWYGVGEPHGTIRSASLKALRIQNECRGTYSAVSREWHADLPPTGTTAYGHAIAVVQSLGSLARSIRRKSPPRHGKSWKCQHQS